MRANVCSQILSILDIFTPSEIELDWVIWHQNLIWELFEIFQQAFRICLNISFISKNMATRLCWKLVSKKLFRVKYQTFGPLLEWNFRLLTVMPDFGPEGVIAGHFLIVGVWLYYKRPIESSFNIWKIPLGFAVLAAPKSALKELTQRKYMLHTRI